MCDEGRYSYKAANDANLLAAMYVRKNDDLHPVPVDEAITAADRGLKQVVEQGGIIAGVLSPFLTVEEAYLMASYVKGLNPANVLALGPVPVRGEDRKFRPDTTRGRTGDTSFVVPRPFTIRAEKCPNRRGVSAILEHFQGSVIAYEELSRRVAAGDFQSMYITSGDIESWIDDGSSSSLRSKLNFLVVQDTGVTPLAHLADVVLAGATFAEKAGCYVNADGRLQYSEAALPPREGCLPDLDLFAILLHRPGGGPVRSSEVLAELGEKVPSLAVARGGNVHPFGVAMGSATPPDGALRVPVFVDRWFQSGEAARWR
jgi:NADH-quinone oxidoreductase subunit G